MYEKYKRGEATEKDLIGLAKEKSKVSEDYQAYHRDMSNRFTEAVNKALSESGKKNKNTISSLPANYTKQTLSQKMDEFNAYQADVYQKFLSGTATQEELAEVAARRDSLQREAQLYANSPQGIAEAGEEYKRQAETYKIKKENAQKAYRLAEDELHKAQENMNNYTKNASYGSKGEYDRLGSELTAAQKRYNNAKKAYQNATALLYEAASYKAAYIDVQTAYMNYLVIITRQRKTAIKPPPT